METKLLKTTQVVAFICTIILFSGCTKNIITLDIGAVY